MAKSNRREKKINFYQHKIYACEAELMEVQRKYSSLPKGVLDLDKGRSNHIHRLQVKMQKIESIIKRYQQMIEEVKAI
jgi:predicted transcriptional regulator with HTH domain